jgi:phytoene desaturase
MADTTALVVGAGVGGIAAAARLARSGYRVTVVEKTAQPGGRCGRLVRDGHVFDTGPTLFLMPEYYARTFADLGERIEHHLDLSRIDPTYHIHFDDGLSMVMSSDLKKLEEQLEEIEPGSFRGLMRYLDEGCRNYRQALPALVERDYDRLFQFLTPRILYLIVKLGLLAGHYGRTARYFKDRHLRAAFTFQDMYLSLSPYRAPATFSLLPYAELVGGVWFPEGGMGRVVEVLVGLAERAGAQFAYNAPVERIETENGRASGVRLADGRRLTADVIVANADLPYVYHSLLPRDRTARRLARKRYTCSAVTFY